MKSIMRKVRKLTSPGSHPGNTCYQLVLFQMPNLMLRAILLYNKFKKEKKRKRQKTKDDDWKVASYFVKDRTQIIWNSGDQYCECLMRMFRKYYFYGYACAKVKTKLSLQLKRKTGSWLLWDVQLFYQSKRWKGVCGCEKLWTQKYLLT